MRVRFRCTCGCLILADAALSGGLVGCPKCRAPVAVPPPEEALPESATPDDVPLIVDESYRPPDTNDKNDDPDERRDLTDMRVRFRCACGCLILTDAALSGGLVGCPKCHAPVAVPLPQDGLTESAAPDDVPLIVDEAYRPPEIGPDEEEPGQRYEVTDAVVSTLSLLGDESVDITLRPPPSAAPPARPDAGPPPVGVSAGEGSDQPRRREIGEAGDDHLSWGERIAWRRRAEEVEGRHRAFLRRFTLWRAFAESLAFPIRESAGWTTLLLPALLVLAGFAASLMMSGSPAAVVIGVVSGPMLAILSATLALGWVSEVLRAATEGPSHAPDWKGRDFITERFWPGVKALAHFAVIVLVPAIVIVGLLGDLTIRRLRNPDELVLEATTQAVLAAILVGYYPMSLAVLMGFGSFWASLNPLVVVRAILKAPVEYGLTAAFALGLGALSLFGANWLAARFGREWRLLWPWFAYYGFCVMVSRLGFLIYRKRYVLGWGHERSDRVHEDPELKARKLAEVMPHERDDLGGEMDQWLRFRCTCGRTLTLPFTALGTHATCPACGKRIKVPGTMPEEEAEDRLDRSDPSDRSDR